MDEQQFKSYCQEGYNLSVSDEQAQMLLTYMDELLIINDQINLTAITDEVEFIDKHLVDSLLCNLDDLPEGAKVLDIGTGGGFPGIPLAIKYPHLNFTLLDSTAKKLKMVEQLANDLELTNVDFLAGRAEEFANDPAWRQGYDVVVSRGVARYTILAELCIPFLKKGGRFYSWKAKKYQEELKEATNCLKLLNSEVTNIIQHLLLKTNDVHVIICSIKNDDTPKKYPRNYGTIKKRPL